MGAEPVAAFIQFSSVQPLAGTSRLNAQKLEERFEIVTVRRVKRRKVLLSYISRPS